MAVLLSGLKTAPLMGQVTAAYEPPETYYAGISAISGSALRTQLHDLIDGHWIIGYNNLPDLFSVIDADPQVPGNILLIYSGASVSSGSTSWNREHLWPRSYGADTGPAYSDAHHLFPSDSATNSDRSNYAFANLTASSPLANAPDSRVSDGQRLVEPRDADKGRIARAMLYMDVRYDGSDSDGDLYLSDYPTSFSTRFGKLSDLLEWNRTYPPDERERRRNHLIYTGVRVGNKALFQSNRNPFVDYPDLADAIFTADQLMTWGSWRVAHFSLTELLDLEAVGEAGDPDGDGRTNFLEFALQTDPKTAQDVGLPLVIRGSGTDYFQFNRVPRPEISQFTYVVEASADPYQANSWVEIPFDDRDLLISESGLAETVSLPIVPSGAIGPRHYRLRVSRNTPQGEFSAVYDPAVTTAGGLDIFTYAIPLEEGWVDSGWMGPVQTEGRPWFYHAEHKWLYTPSTDPRQAWFYDFSLGWIFTSRILYPYLYLAASGKWVYYRIGTQAPARVFLDPITAEPIGEADL